MEEEKIAEEQMQEQVETSEPEKEIKEETLAKKTKKEHKHKINKEKDELIKANLELKEKTLRLTAEMQNMRRRFDVDLGNAYKYDGYDMAEKLLPVLDNFERAMSIKQEGTEKFLDGFKMIYDNLISILKEKGITELDVLNKSFDPNVMNAVTTEINNDVESGTVLKVLQKGYMYNDRLLRPAMVSVSEKESE